MPTYDYIIMIICHCFRKSGIKEVGAYVVAVRISDHITFSKQVPVSLLFKLLPVSLYAYNNISYTSNHLVNIAACM